MLRLKGTAISVLLVCLLASSCKEENNEEIPAVEFPLGKVTFFISAWSDGKDEPPLPLNLDQKNAYSLFHRLLDIETREDNASNAEGYTEVISVSYAPGTIHFGLYGKNEQGELVFEKLDPERPFEIDYQDAEGAKEVNSLLYSKVTPGKVRKSVFSYEKFLTEEDKDRIKAYLKEKEKNSPSAQTSANQPVQNPQPPSRHD